MMRGVQRGGGGGGGLPGRGGDAGQGGGGAPGHPGGLHPLEVRHLLPEEQDPLLLQRGLDLRQPDQGPRHLQVSRDLQ